MPDSAVPKAKSPGRVRRTAVENEILRCVALGEIADFTKGRWPTGKGADARPVVSGKFLSDLWLGLLDGRIHPVGIGIKGLRVEGRITLGGARVDARLRTPLIGFAAEDCHFDSVVDVGNARVETMGFRNCVFDYRDGEDGGLSMGSAEIIGSLGIHSCTVHGSLWLRNAVVDDDVLIEKSTFARGVRLGGAEVRGGVKIQRVAMDGAADGTTIAFEAIDAVIAGNLELDRCTLTGALALNQLQTAAITMSRVRCKGESAKLVGLYARVAHSLRMVGCHFPAGADLSASSMGAQLYCYRTIFGSAGLPRFALDLNSVRAAVSVLLSRCRLHGGIGAVDLDAGRHLELWQCAFLAASANQITLHALRIRAGVLTTTDCFLGGQIQLSYAALGSVTMTRCAIAMCGRNKRRLPSPDVGPLAVGVNLYGAQIERDLVMGECHVDGGMSLQAVQAGGQVVARNCWFGREQIDNSVQMWGLRADKLVEFTRCVMPSGLYAANVDTATFNINGCVCQGHAKGASAGVGINLSSAQIRDTTFIGFSRAEDEVCTVIDGSIYAADASLGATITLSGVRQTATPQYDNGWAGGISFAGAKLGDVFFSGIGAFAAPTELAGCLAFDRASINAMRFYRGCTMTASGAPADANFFSLDADAIARVKAGVALSLLGATVARGLMLAGAKFSGMVDLKALTVNALLDRGGDAWAGAGLGQGQLRLDGLAYADLDDDDLTQSDGGTAAAGTTANPKGPVARRLDWLAMQYPAGQACARSFAPQPYEQLARHYGAMGDERSRRQVLVRKRQLQRDHSGLGWVERSVSALLGVTSNYGYSPGRASLWTLGLVLIGALCAILLHGAGAMVQTDADKGVLSFAPLLYAIDVAVPFLDLGHDAAWRIDPMRLADWPGRNFSVQLAEALYRVAGVIILSITVLTFSGVLREKD